MNGYTVYMHKNKVNQKVYIGVTKRELSYRWKNGRGYHHNKYFLEAIKKYGWNGFEHLVLYDNLTEYEAYEKEKELIRKYKSNNEEYGYNQSTGGKYPRKGCTFKMSDEQKQKISKANIGKPGGMLGKKQSVEAKAKISKGLMGNQNTLGFKQSIKTILLKSKATLCIDTGKLYISAREASRDTGVNYGNLTQCCKGRRKTAGGYHWQYKESEEK